MRLLAVAAPGVLAGSRTADELFAAACAAHDVDGELLRTTSREEYLAALAGADLVLPGDDEPLGDLLSAPVVRVDVEAREPDPSPLVRRHVHSRGLGGLRFAVDAWWFHATSPAVAHAYGPHPDQRGELRLPASDRHGEGPFPVAVLVHGGYWRSRWENDLMDALAVDLVARGWAAWNVEYRRPDRHGWDATTRDVGDALQVLAGLEAPLDLTSVVTFGHSAGGQLVVRLAADAPSPVTPALTVSLAGCLDLRTIHDRWLSEGAVAGALGGSPADLPDVYAASSPIARVPVGAPLLVVCCTGDDPDLLDASRRFADAARAAGDEVDVLERDGDHFSVIDPGSAVWAEVCVRATRRAGVRVQPPR